MSSVVPGDYWKNASMLGVAGQWPTGQNQSVTCFYWNSATQTLFLASSKLQRQSSVWQRLYGLKYLPSGLFIENTCQSLFYIIKVFKGILCKWTLRFKQSVTDGFIQETFIEQSSMVGILEGGCKDKLLVFTELQLRERDH